MTFRTVGVINTDPEIIPEIIELFPWWIASSFMFLPLLCFLLYIRMLT